MNILFFLRPKNEVDYLISSEKVDTGYKQISDLSYTALPVIDESGKYIGTVSEGDFLRYYASNNKDSQKTISDIIRADFNPPVYVTATIKELLYHTMERNFVPIIDDRGCFIGIVTRRSILSYLIEKVDFE